MKKLIGVILVLMMVVTGLAYAETTARVAETAEGYVLVQLKDADEKTLALIGSGDGVDVLDAFASGEDTYAGKFDRFWKMMLLLQPTVSLEGSIENMGFEPALDSKSTMVTLNGVVIAQLNGLETFAIVSGGELPVTKDGCDVHIWAKAGVTGSVCANCGKMDDGSKVHDELISPFCDEKHTKCMGDPNHVCDVCGRKYECSKSNSHTECTVCGKAWCDKSEGDHLDLECGHRGCEVYGNEKQHTACELCGEYLCNGESHEHSTEQPGQETDGGIPEDDVVVIS